jgi:fumarate hydratase class II
MQALTMVCAQVIGNDVQLLLVVCKVSTINVLNLSAANFLQSARLLADACNSFDLHCAKRIEQTIAELKN